jgi:hypothetical protein
LFSSGSLWMCFVSVVDFYFKKKGLATDRLENEIVGKRETMRLRFLLGVNRKKLYRVMNDDDRLHIPCRAHDRQFFVCRRLRKWRIKNNNKQKRIEVNHLCIEERRAGTARFVYPFIVYPFIHEWLAVCSDVNGKLHLLVCWGSRQPGNLILLTMQKIKKKEETWPKADDVTFFCTKKLGLCTD